MKKIILVCLHLITLATIGILAYKTWAVETKLNKEKQPDVILKKEMQQPKNLFHNKQKKLIRMPNPASVECEKRGGVLKMEQIPKGKIGVCYFKNNQQCEEWALFRNECPKGGINVSKYSTPAARYCVIIGGKYKIKSSWSAKTKLDTAKELGNCKLPNGKICDVWELWTGNCPKY